MKQAIRLVLQEGAFAGMLDALAAGRARAGGVTAGAASILAAAVNEAAGRPVLLVVPHIDLAEDLHENARLFAPDCALLEPLEAATSFEETGPVEANRSRIRLFQRYLPGGSPPAIVVTSAPALVENAPARGDLAAGVFEAARGETVEMRGFIKWLLEHGFKREYEAENPWQVAARGGIVDVFPPGEDFPLRVEFFGDEISSIRAVNPITAISVRELESLRIVSPAPARAKQRPSPFTGLLAPETVVFVWEPGDVQRAAQDHFNRVSAAEAVAWGDVWRELERFALVESSAFEFGEKNSLSFHCRAFSIAAREVEGIVEEFAGFARGMRRTWVFAANAAEKSRLEQLFGDSAPEGDRLFTAAMGRFNRSFYFSDRRLAFIGHQDIFHRYRQRRRLRPPAPSRPISSLLELTPGDYVVHSDHGIARYRGAQVIEKDGIRREYLVLQFAGKTRLLVPVTHIDLVSRYVGPSDRAPALSTIGSKIWKARKARVARAVRELAAELLRLQAVRAAKPGIAYEIDRRMQNQFEAEFIYEETDDQLKALEEIKQDMRRRRPMDRLLCGDVGFGKTELAVRAAFAAVANGKQVGVLVPTTILAEQHYRTFCERMADYPVLIEVLSRLRPKSLQRETVKRLRKKQADIVIGTHRLIQKDVVFADLGLVIIDEEQRFGVEAKERLKRLRETVDVLTLTATPIPRTLHMALVGLRDICILETPPRGRQAITTFVGRLSPDRLREVILRELGREGQVFFVHNRVHSIEETALGLKRIVPEARITVAHGQMNEELLAARMVDFIERRYDVLVATTIIESGLDIPNVNTIIVDQADIFGLADLHQLRGRVGRYLRHAYAYFLLPETRALTPEAAQRLQAIEHFSELGAGFRIALRDMEIRGVGNVLGREQSGHIAMVGYELFCRLLAEAVSAIRGQPPERIPESYLELGVSSYIPDSYVESPQQRLELYRRLSSALSLEEVEGVESELADRFGPMPDEAAEFVRLARVRILAFRSGIRMIMRRADHLAIQAGQIQAAAGLFEGNGRTVRIIDDASAAVLFDGKVPAGVALLDMLISLLQREPVGI